VHLKSLSKMVLSVFFISGNINWQDVEHLNYSKIFD